MKKSILLLVVLCLITGMFGGALVNAESVKFDGLNEMNVVYIGGSITEGAGINRNGVTGEKSWVQLVGEYLTQTYSGTKVNNYNVGIGGTPSALGIARLEADVISKNPDVVFVEFAVNDAYGGLTDTNKENVVANMEGIVRNLLTLDKVPYVVFIYTTQFYNGNEYYDVSEWHEEVAQNYGIKSIDLQPIVEEHIAGGGVVTDLLGDNVHPNATGYQLYADKIIECLETGEYYNKPDASAEWLTQNAEKRYDYVLRSARISADNFDSNFYIAGSSERSGRRTETKGAVFELDFYGTSVAIQVKKQSEFGTARVEIDGETVEVMNSGNGVVSSLGFVKRGLDYGRHTLRVINAQDKTLWIERVFVDDGMRDYGSNLVACGRVVKANTIPGFESSDASIYEITVKNENTSALDEVVLCAIYDTNDTLKGVSKQFINLEKDEYKTIGLGNEISSGDYVKIMQWNSLEEMKTIYKKLIFR